MSNVKKSKKQKSSSHKGKQPAKEVAELSLSELEVLLKDMKVKAKGAPALPSPVAAQPSTSDANTTCGIPGSSTTRKLKPPKDIHVLIPRHIMESFEKDPILLDYIDPPSDKSDPESSSRPRSLLFSQKASEVRCRMRDGRVPFTQGYLAGFLDSSARLSIESSIPGNVFNWDNELKNVLHYVVKTGDLPLVYEYLYLGMDPDYKDVNGESVFASAVRMLSEKTKSVPGVRGNRATTTTGSDPTYLDRLTKIIELFIGQHADVNQKFKGKSLLQMACRSNSEHNWKVINLLLQHGASASLPLSNYFPSSEDDRGRLSRLKASVVAGGQRPDRICPCWSGKILLECHGVHNAKISYPNYYLCPCGSKKSYKACCEKRWPLFETWDAEKGRIISFWKSKMSENASPELAEVMSNMQSLSFMDDDDDGNQGKETSAVPFKGLTKEKLEKFRVKMIELGLVDEAFAFAMRLMRFPLPVNRKTAARLLRSAQQTNWNACIDKYIALGVDKRSRFDIERAAKISQWGGPYIRDCEFAECGKVEFRDVEKMRQCAKCQIIVYCSQECQKADWPRHKQECGAEWQAPRGLPSQENIMRYFLENDPGLRKVSERLQRERGLSGGEARDGTVQSV
ncbi:hypothetical protein CPC08DRAFT_708165 [Agrocybe pediades]|nr:hypothetical protein CPC08DRAFT_708165 [Agrocybe pediades]